MLLPPGKVHFLPGPEFQVCHKNIAKPGKLCLAISTRPKFFSRWKQVEEKELSPPTPCLYHARFFQVDLQEEKQVGQVVERGGPRQAIQVEMSNVHSACISKLHSVLDCV